MAIGLFIAGIASYLFLKIAKSALGGTDEAIQPLSSLWFATFALAPGFFLPVEQEVARALSHRRAMGQGGRPVVRRVIQLCAMLAGAVIAAVLALGPTLSTHFFGHNWVMVLALLLSFVAYAPAHVARGISSGSGRFRSYSVVIGGDGVVRIVVCLALAVIGVKAIGAYGLIFALAPLPPVIFVAVRGWLRTEDGPPASWHEVTPNLGWLLLGSVFAAGLVNAGPLAATILRAPNEKALVTQFGWGVLLARVPLFMFQAVQAALLPRLARLAARDEITEFRNGLTRLLKVVLVVAVVGTTGAYLLGPTIIDKFYGAQLSKKTMAMLALGSAMYMFALALAQAVIALRGHALVALGWGIGMVTLVLVTWLSSHNLFRRIEYGLVASSLAALIAFVVALRHLLRRGAPHPTGEHVIEAITDMPFET